MGKARSKGINNVSTSLRVQFQVLFPAKLFVIMILTPLAISLILWGLLSSVFDKAFIEYLNSLNILFIVVCSLVFIGTANALTLISKERKEVKRELQSRSYSPVSYVIAKILFLMIVALIQSLIIGLPFFRYPSFSIVETGLLYSIPEIEFIFTIFLTILSASILSLSISSMIRDASSTAYVLPLLLISQVIFSNILFEIDSKWMNYISALVISKWSIRAFGTILDFNSMHYGTQNYYMLNRTVQPSSDFTYATGNLLNMWGILGIFILVFAIVTIVNVADIKNDAR